MNNLTFVAAAARGLLPWESAGPLHSLDSFDAMCAVNKGCIKRHLHM